MKTYTIVTLLVLLTAGLANADMKVNVESAERCRVSLNGRYRGLAPITFDNLTAGVHEIEVENVDTKDFKVFRVEVPRGEWLVRTYEVDFYGPTQVNERVVERHSFVATPEYTGNRLPPPVVERVYYRPAARRAYYRPAPRRVYHRRPRRRVVPCPAPVVVHQPSRNKVRRRNAILAAGVANEMFNDGRRRKDVRKGALTATLLNEILTR